MFQQDFNKTYYMVNPTIRNNIIQKINNGEMVSETVRGKKENWWLVKHHPNKEIPKNIYLLGQGTIKEIYDSYLINYGNIEWSEFIDYTRELIKQKIMT